ncbi:hypothetical protein PAEPH01_1014 [Pancytospora epiphaga]|nr:hypothetical protein PAEPH01_1014 [Pancytospora epiphaga]
MVLSESCTSEDSENNNERISEEIREKEEPSMAESTKTPHSTAGDEKSSNMKGVCEEHSEYKLGCAKCLTKKDVFNKATYTSENEYVWSLGPPTGNIGNYATMSDLEEGEEDECKRGYIEAHKNIMLKHLGYSIFIFLRQGIFYRLLFPVESINCHSRFLRESPLSYSNKPLFIPGWLECAMRMLFIKDLRQHGIFRVNSTIQRVKDVQSIVNDIVEGRMEEHRGIRMLINNFDTIDIAETYKQLLRSFNTTVISYKYFSTIKAIQKIENESEKVICTRAFLYSLPSLNRAILESNARLVHILVAKMKYELNNKQMNLEGMSKVMMPCLMLKSDDNIAIEDILVFAEFIHFLLKNFITLIRI